MGLFDNNAAEDAAAAMRTGYNQAEADAAWKLAMGIGASNDYYGRALVPFSTLYGRGLSGVDAYTDALGLNGPDGSARAVSRFQTSPGYQFQLDQGTQAIERGASARSSLADPSTKLALMNFGQGVANQEYGNYLNRYSPFFTLAGQGATGVGNVNSALAGSNYDYYKTL